MVSTSMRWKGWKTGIYMYHSPYCSFSTPWCNCYIDRFSGANIFITQMAMDSSQVTRFPWRNRRPSLITQAQIHCNNLDSNRHRDMLWHWSRCIAVASAIQPTRTYLPHFALNYYDRFTEGQLSSHRYNTFGGYMGLILISLIINLYQPLIILVFVGTLPMIFKLWKESRKGNEIHPNANGKVKSWIICFSFQDEHHGVLWT